MNLSAAREMTTATFREWSKDKVPQLGAALAYYTIFSIAPLVLIAIALAGIVFGEEAARGEIMQQISATVGPSVAEAIQAILAQAQDKATSGMATLIGVAVLLFGASGVFIQLQDALNTIWKVEAKPEGGIWSLVRDRLLSFTVVLGTGFLLLVSLVASAALAALSKYFTPADLPGGAFAWQTLNNLLSFALVTVLFAFIYRVLPDVHVGWRHVWTGALIAALLFTVGKYVIGLYLGRSGTASAFGAAGSLVVILVWVYYSAQILLLGAEVTRSHALYQGAQIEPKANARWKTCESGEEATRTAARAAGGARASLPSTSR